MRKSRSRPRLENLEDRLVPGSVLRSPLLFFEGDILDPRGMGDFNQEGWRPSLSAWRDDGGDNSNSGVSLSLGSRLASTDEIRWSSAGTDSNFVTFAADAGSPSLPTNLDAMEEGALAQYLSGFAGLGGAASGFAGSGNGGFAPGAGLGNNPTAAAAPGSPVGDSSPGLAGFDAGLGAGHKAVLVAAPAVSALSAATAASGAASTYVIDGHDPYALYQAGDSFTGDTGLDRQSFQAQHHPLPSVTRMPDPVPSGINAQGLGTGSPDPGVPGPYAVTTQQYNFGLTAFTAPGAPGESNPIPNIELVGEIKAPTDLSAGPRPVIVLLHGRHNVSYQVSNPFNLGGWPPPAGFTSIESFKGYEYLGDNLASHGYIVVSISANGINAQDNQLAFDLGATARAQLIQRHLDILRDLNLTGTVTGLPGGPQTPFGTRYVGKIDLQNIGTMGHSRGGEGNVRQFLYNKSLGSPYGIKAVFALAPVDFRRFAPVDVPFAVLLPYNDGDVSDNQGVHFYDDARYVDNNDPAPKYTIEVLGASHNFYNTVWTPGLYPFPGAPEGAGGTADDGLDGPPTRLTPAQEQGTGLAYVSAFFRTYVGNDVVPTTTEFAPLLRGDVAPPPSAQVSINQIHIGYQPGSNSRLDVDRLLTPAELTTNDLGGAVTTGGLTTYELYGGHPPEAPFVLQLPVLGEVPAGSPLFPHTIPSARSAQRGLSMLHLNYTNTFQAFYQNDVPAASSDVSGFYALQFRVANEFTDARNKPGDLQDFSVTLTDRAGDAFTHQVSTWSQDLAYPPALLGFFPRDILNTVRIPLASFAGVDLTQVASIRFNFDQRADGGFLIDDVAFADPANLYTGPFVVSAAPLGNPLPGQVQAVEVAFNTSIDASTFTTDQVTFTGPDGTPIPVTDVSPVDGTSNSHFIVSFDPLAGIGGPYTMVIGPHVRDTLGNEMDQNFNGTLGEDPADTFTLHFTIHGPQVIASIPTDAQDPPITSVRVTFNEPMIPATFTTSSIVSFTRTVGTSVTDLLPSLLSVTTVEDSGNTQFDVTCATQTRTGIYTLSLGPNVLDRFGNPMDQNDNGIPGEVPGDVFTTSFGITGLQVASAAPSGTVAAPVGSLRVTFNRPIDPSTFQISRGDVVSFTRTVGTVVTNLLPSLTGITPVAGSGNTQFDVTFPTQTATGIYRMVIGQNVRDLFGNAMDQDGDFVPGEPTDQFTAQFNVLGPRIIAQTPVGTNTGPISTLRVTFNTAIDPATFDKTKVFSFTGPTGAAIPIASVTVVAGSGNRQFDLAFASQSAPGVYTIVIGPDIRDPFGNPMDQNGNFNPGEIPGDRYTGTFQIVPAYAAAATPFEKLEIAGQPGTFTLIAAADDLSVSVNLGTNSFTFFGRTFTGNNQLDVSSNGLISFLTLDDALVPNDLASSRFNEPVIAPLWDDWTAGTGSPMVLGKFEDVAGVGRRLILEWNRIDHYLGTPQAITFQAILELNTGTRPGSITFNYVNLNTGETSFTEGRTAAVGIKDFGVQGTARILVKSPNDSSSVLVGTGQAVKLTTT
jgi:hypothetical protein